MVEEVTVVWAREEQNVTTNQLRANDDNNSKLARTTVPGK